MFDSAEFVVQFEALQKIANTNARRKGVWMPGADVPGQLAGIHREVSEAYEALRLGNRPSVHIPGFTQVEEELADAVLRIMTLAEGDNLRVAAAMLAKLEYNEGRPHRHGKEF